MFPALPLQPIFISSVSNPYNFLRRLDFFMNGLMISARYVLSLLRLIKNTELSISIPS